MKKYIAELFGTFVLTLFGCGAAALAGQTLGMLGVAFAFGLSIVSMAYVIGNVSGCHINPAVSLGVWMSGRMTEKDFVGYVISQCLGALLAACLLAAIINATNIGPISSTGLGANGFGDYSAIGLQLEAALFVEMILTCVFVLTVLCVTDNIENDIIAGLIIGLTLTFVHILGIPLTGTSVNPARSFGPALVMGGAAWSQLWVFIVGPFTGAGLAALIWKRLRTQQEE